MCRHFSSAVAITKEDDSWLVSLVLAIFFGMSDEDEYANTQETAAVTNEGEPSVRPNNVVSMQAAGATKMNKIVLCEPRIYSDAKKSRQKFT